MILKKINISEYGIGLISNFSMFFLVGLIVKMHFDVIKQLLITGRWLFLILFLTMTCFWKFNNYPTFVQDPGKVVSFTYYFMTAIMGIAAICSFVFRYIKDNQESPIKWIRPFIFFGKITLGLYAIHTQIILGFLYPYFEVYHRGVAIIMTFIVTLIVSVLVERALNIGKLLPQLLLGKIG